MSCAQPGALSVLIVALVAGTALAQPVVLKDNGPFVTAQGVGFGGADVSIAQVNPTGDGNTYLGLGVTNTVPASGPGGGGPFRNADSFTVPEGEVWTLDRVEFFAFQPQSSNFSTTFGYTGAFIAVYTEPPGNESVPAWGNYETNRLRGGGFANAYRTTANLGLTFNRYPIMRVDIDTAWLPPLPAGTYWFAVSLLGEVGPGRSSAIQGLLVTPNPQGAASRRYANVAPFNGWFDAPLEWPYRLLGTAAPVRPPCPADITGIGGPPSRPDGLLTGDDFNAFIAAFAAGDPLADITGIGGPPSQPDGLLTGDDFNAFIAAFAGGCP
jgi:hypothetical protein